MASGEDKFYKVVHSDRDILVATKPATISNGEKVVSFDILTRYGEHHHYSVSFVNGQPASLSRE
jgi:hypothetical protein